MKRNKIYVDWLTVLLQLIWTILTKTIRSQNNIKEKQERKLKQIAKIIY